MIENNPDIRFRKKLSMDLAVDIDNLDDSLKLIYNALKEWWSSDYLADLDPDDNIPAVIEQWSEKYVNTDIVKDAIEKIKEASPPEEFEIKLVIDLLTREGFLKLEDDIPLSPMFRPFVLSKHNIEFSLDTYFYNKDERKFESLEPMDMESLVDEGFSQEFISKFYDFNNRLLRTTSKKLRLHTTQPEKRIEQWNKQGYIPKNFYFTDNIHRAEYYFNPEENDIIVSYKIPENELIMTSDFGGAKEYVTIKDVHIE
jgi:hypothetical protein